MIIGQENVPFGPLLQIEGWFWRISFSTSGHPKTSQAMLGGIAVSKEKISKCFPNKIGSFQSLAKICKKKIMIITYRIHCML